MWTDPEEARSDFILAAAATLFGPLLVFFLQSLLPPLFRGTVGNLVQLALFFAYTGLVPLLLARYRDQGLEAFGLDEGREGLVPGVLVAVPIVVVAIGLQLALSGDVVAAVLGTLAGVLAGPVALLMTILRAVVVAAAVVLLYTFLTTKARNAFARNEVPQVEMLRTFGIAAAGAGFLAGLLLLVRGGSVLRVLIEALTLAAVVLLADRFVTASGRTTRATVLAPAIVALVVKLELFGGNFLPSLRGALLGAGLVIVVAVLLETRRYAWAALPVLVATVLWPTPLIPV